MGIRNGNTFEWVYQRYLEWFHSKARQNAKPKSAEDVIGFHLFHEDVFESQRLILSRMIYSIPLLTSESDTGKAEFFTFSELNLMEKVFTNDGEDEIEEIVPVEYVVL